MQIFYKMVFDISCYYTFASFFLSFVLEYKMSSFSMSLFLVSGLMIVYSQKLFRIGRWIALCSAIFPIFFRPWGSIDYVLLEFIIPWLYFVILVYRENYAVYYANFKALWKDFLYASSILIVVFLFNVEKGLFAAEVATPYFIVFLSAGVLLMQNLRFPPESINKKVFEKYQIKQTILFFLFCFLLTASNLWQIVYQYVLLPLKNRLTSFLLEFFDFLLSFVSKPNMELPNSPFYDYREYLEKVQETIESNSVQPKWGEVLTEVGVVQEKIDATPLLIAFGMLIAMIIFAILMGHGSKKTKQLWIKEEREELQPIKEIEKNPMRFSMDSEKMIRFYYRNFMRKAETTKQTVFKSDTTQEILHKFLLKKPEQEEQAEELTKIYQKVRYSKKKVSHEDTTRMKRLVKNI